MIPETLYAAWYNMSGLSFETPRLVRYNYDLESWWHKSGNFDVSRPGLVVNRGYVSFSSESKEEVQIFIDGILTVGYFLTWKFPARTSTEKLLKKRSKEA